MASGENKLTGVAIIAGALFGLWLYDTGRFDGVARVLKGEPASPAVPPGAVAATSSFAPAGAVAHDSLVASTVGQYNQYESVQQQLESYIQSQQATQQVLAGEHQLASDYGYGAYHQGPNPAAAATGQALDQCKGVGDCIGKGIVWIGSTFGNAIGSLF